MLKRIAATVFVGLFGISAVRPMVARGAGWRIDQEHSTARLFLASSESPETKVNVGVARVSGFVDPLGHDAKDSDFDFTIYPADKTVASLQSNDDQRPGNPPIAPDFTVITFKSKQVVPVGAGAFRVTGDLTVTYVERIARYDANWGYAGPVYDGPSIVHSAKQEAVFEFRSMDAMASGAPKGGTAELSASSKLIGVDNFPELFTAVSATNWPAFVVDERCTMPLVVGEDFSGPVCTGKTVELASRTDIHCEMPLVVGEDFAGEVCTGTPLQMAPGDAIASRTKKHHHRTGAPDELVADEVKIQLDLRLTGANSVLSGSVVQK